MHLAVYRGPAKTLAHKLFHLLVCLRTFSRYSHCELVIDGVCWSASSRDGGVRRKVIDLHSGHWDMFPLDTDAYDKQYALAYFAARKGWKYSWAGVWRLGFRLFFLRVREGEAFCSQICAGALKLDKPENYHIQKLVSTVF